MKYLLSIFMLVKIYGLEIPVRNKDYNNIWDCICKDGKDNKYICEKDHVDLAMDCNGKRPSRNWRCCYYELENVNGDLEYGCMRYKKGNKTDLNDLYDYIRQRGSFASIVCKTNILKLNLALLLIIVINLL